MYTIGVLTRDEREHVDNCQVLVMEPHCAETLLLAGAHSALLPRIRYVIFDEVHNIVGQGGEVWEHLLTFISAPFVALSATVGNPVEFGRWLGRLEAVRAGVLSACVIWVCPCCRSCCGVHSFVCGCVDVTWLLWWQCCSPSGARLVAGSWAHLRSFR